MKSKFANKRRNSAELILPKIKISSKLAKRSSIVDRRPALKHQDSEKVIKAVKETQYEKIILVKGKIKVGHRYLLKDCRYGICVYLDQADLLSKGKKEEWIGIVLEKGFGKHNGTYKGITYFKAPKNKGIFVKRHKLSRDLGAVIPKFYSHFLTQKLQTKPQTLVPYPLLPIPFDYVSDLSAFESEQGSASDSFGNTPQDYSMHKKKSVSSLRLHSAASLGFTDNNDDSDSDGGLYDADSASDVSDQYDPQYALKIDVRLKKVRRAKNLNWIEGVLDDEGVLDIYKDLGNGVVLCKILDRLIPGSINWGKVDTKCKKEFDALGNCNHFLDACVSRFGFTLVSADAKDIFNGKKVVIDSLLKQMERFHRQSKNFTKNPEVLLSDAFSEKDEAGKGN